jgi:hypothetical protein
LEKYRAEVTDESIAELLRPTLGELSFSGIERPLTMVRDVLDEAVPQEGDIPNRRVTEAAQLLDQLTQSLQRVREFSVTEANPAANRDGLLQQIRDVSDRIVECLRPMCRGGGAAMARRLDETEALLGETRAENQRLSELIAQVRQGEVQLAGGSASEFYENLAAEHKNTARRFLWSTIGLLVVLAVFAAVELVLVIVSPPVFASLGDALAAGLPKVTVIVVLSFAVGFSARNYRINMHLSVLNRTKSRTLMSATHYAAGVEQPEHRDLVVATLVQSVFALGDTGYLPVESERTIVETPGAVSLLGSTVPRVNP